MDFAVHESSYFRYLNYRCSSQDRKEFAITVSSKEVVCVCGGRGEVGEEVGVGGEDVTVMTISTCRYNQSK